MGSSDKPSKCPSCGSKDFEHEYRNNYCCNKCENVWTHSWESDWKDEEIYALKTAIQSRDSDYPEYLPKTRSISINKGRCYFCNRSEKDWKAIHTQIMDYLESETASLGADSGARKKKVKDAVKSFKKTWSKVNSRHKVSTLMSDPHEFFPNEISKYWNEDWDHGASLSESSRGKPFSDYFGKYREIDNPEWFSLERLCLGWLFHYHTDYHSAVAMRTREEKKNEDVRVKNIEKIMLKEITESFEENLERGDSGMTVDEKITAEKILLHRLSSLQEMHSGLRRFSWKPWSDNDIMEGVRSYGGEDRSDLLSINTWICPLCWDRFQSQTD